MQFKSITVIIVLLLIVVSLLVAGCTTSTTNQTTSATPSTAIATHDAFLEKYIAQFKNVSYADTNLNFKVWDVAWINSTSVRLENTALNKSTNTTVNRVETIIVFPTTQDATNYLNALNKTAYSLASTQYISGGAYQKAIGHAPQIYKDYVWNEGNPFNISEYKYHEITQIDNMVIIHTGKTLS